MKKCPKCKKQELKDGEELCPHCKNKRSNLLVKAGEIVIGLLIIGVTAFIKKKLPNPDEIKRVLRT